MDKIWGRKSFKVRGHWLLWRGWNTKWPRRTDKSRTLKRKFFCIFELDVFRNATTGHSIDAKLSTIKLTWIKHKFSLLQSCLCSHFIIFQLPSHAQWGSSPSPVSTTTSGRSLLEIQQQEETERLEREEVGGDKYRKIVLVSWPYYVMDCFY